MQLIIRMKNGSPADHPILLSNFCEAFPSVDLENLPPGFSWFERVESAPGKFEIATSSSYQFVDGIYKDVWVYRPMTQSERQAVPAEMTSSGSAPHVIG